MENELNEITDLQKEKRDKLLKILDYIKEKKITGNLLININNGNLCNNYKIEIFDNLDK